MRISLTAKQLETGRGAELLHLLALACTDDSVSPEGAAALQEWALTNRSAPLPAIAYLLPLLDAYSVDPTPENIRRLRIGIETVLPIQLREPLHSARVNAERAHRAAQIENARAEKQRAKQEARRMKERQRPIARFNFMVAGVSHENRDTNIRRYLREGDPVYFVRQPHNRYDKHAVSIRLANGADIGFIPRDEAKTAALLLDAGHQHRAYCSRLLTQSRYPIPVVSAAIYYSDAALEPDPPPRRPVDSGGEAPTPTVTFGYDLDRPEPDPNLIGILFVAAFILAVVGFLIYQASR